jgi:hypothetical protein
MTLTSAAASYLARFFGQDAVTIQSNPGGRGEAVEVRWNGGLATIHPAPRAMYRVNCALAYEDTTLLSLPDAVERMITRAIANTN